jgi:hypothetical protein
MQSWNMQGINESDDPNFPFKLRVRLEHDPKMVAQLQASYGPYDEMVVQAKTVDALLALIQGYQTSQNPLFVSFVIRDTAGIVLYLWPPNADIN